ncbi:MAG: GWxTD domain-containing protein [Candidatus Zixiibacteriota bacterium]
MLRKYLLFIKLFSFILLPSIIFADEDNHDLAVYAGVVIYNNPVYDSVILVEFPFSVNRDEFEFFNPDSTDTNLYSRIYAQVDLLNRDGYLIDSAKTYFSVRVATLEEAMIKNNRIFNKMVLVVKPGNYSARLTVIDVVSKAKGEYFLDNIVIDSVEKERISIGGSCLAYDIKYIGEDSKNNNTRLYKNGFSVLVNPVSIFADTDTILYLYSEIYNLKYSPSVSSEYKISLAVFDSDDSVFKNYGSRVKRKPGATSVVTESIGINAWQKGTYKLQLIATDFETKKADTINLPFQIISTENLIKAASRMKPTDPYDSFTLKDKINLAKHFLTPQQKRILSSLNDSGKVNFLEQYWKEHDEIPGTNIIEKRIEITNRYLYSNKFFSTNEKRNNGWSTDRGRIFITYGKWDERDDFQAPRIGNPYVVWYYRSIKEGKLFIFEDWTGNEDYRLVHSTVYGEIYSKEWQDKINLGIIEIFE